MILRQAVSTTRWYNIDLLIEDITNLGARLVAAQPKGKQKLNLYFQTH